MTRCGSLALVLVAVCPLLVSGQNRPAPSQVEISPGIFVFSTPPYGDVGLDGNAIAITSSDGVLVFDTNTPDEDFVLDEIGRAHV